MRTHKPDVDNPEIILNGSDDPVFIPFDVEYHTVVGQETGIPVNILDVRGTLPPGMLNIEIPCLKRLLRIRVLFPKLTQRFPRDYTHGNIILCSRIGSKQKIGLAIGEKKQGPPEVPSP